MDDFEEKRDALFAAVAAEQKLPVDAIAKSMGRYPLSILGLFIYAHDERGQQGFDESFRLIDLTQNLGAEDLHVPNPRMQDPVVLAGKLEQKPFQLSVPRSALNLDRHDLLRLLKQRLGIERPTRQTAFVRATPKSQATPGDVPRRPSTMEARKPSEIGLAGKLHQMPIEDLVQIFQLQRKTGVLHLHDIERREHEHGTIGFAEGDLIAAQAGERTGDDAFFALATLADGLFRFVDEPPGDKNVTRPTASLLMEAVRLKDEAKREP